MPVPQHINFLWGGHLARPKKQARCLFHNISISCGVGILPAQRNRQDACSTTYQFLVGWASCPPKETGKIPVPQHINFLWDGHLARPLQQAKCLFHNISISCGVGILPAQRNRQDACSTTYQFLVGWASCPPTSTGKMPVPQLINFLWGGHLARPDEQARCLFHKQ
jgi:hypothetical protein